VSGLTVLYQGHVYDEMVLAIDSQTPWRESRRSAMIQRKVSCLGVEPAVNLVVATLTLPCLCRPISGL